MSSLNDNAVRILETYRDVMRYGVTRHPRGMECRDMHNGGVILLADQSPLTNFRARHLNLLYCKKELLWYIQADPYADWISEYATAWKKLAQPNGLFYSNYGQYIFRPGEYQYSQFDFVVDELKNDKDSRRAVMTLLQPYHLFRDNSDIVCTYALHFCILEDTLHMTVVMRSNDLIYGFTNDAFCFWSIYQMVYAMLQEKYPKLKRGTYTHTANSLHVYAKHYDMVHSIVSEGMYSYDEIKVPFITAGGVRHLLNTEEGEQNENDEFVQWLTSDD